MIQQRVSLVLLKTEDNRFNYEHVQAVQKGQSFWIKCNTFKVVENKVKSTGEIFNALMVETEAGTMLPVEILEYYSDFRVSQ